MCWVGCCSDDADEDRSLDLCGGDPVLLRTSGSGDGEQEVPLGSRLCQGASMSTVQKNRGLCFQFKTENTTRKELIIKH